MMVSKRDWTAVVILTVIICATWCIFFVSVVSLGLPPILPPAETGSGQSGTEVVARESASRPGPSRADWPIPVSLQRLYDLADSEARRHNVDPRLVRAVIATESGWDTRAVGDSGRSLGLMQLGPAVRRAYHVTNAFDPRQNIRAGVAHLAACLRAAKGDVRQGLARYNAGPMASRGAGRSYARRVVGRLK